MTTTPTDAASPTSPFSLVLPFAPESARVARREMVGWLAGAGHAGEVAEDCQLVVSELVGNAVRHAQALDGDIMEVAWAYTEDGVTIAVTDGGAETQPHQVEAGLAAVSGRGLAIVDAIAKSWWIENDTARTTVHAFLLLPSPGSVLVG